MYPEIKGYYVRGIVREINRFYTKMFKGRNQ